MPPHQKKVRIGWPPRFLVAVEGLQMLEELRDGYQRRLMFGLETFGSPTNYDIRARWNDTFDRVALITEPGTMFAVRFVS